MEIISKKDLNNCITALGYEINNKCDKYGDKTLNDLILKRQPCDNDYLDTFSESYM